MTAEGQAELVFRSGERIGDRVLITRFPFSVGRGEADLVLEDASVSRKHFIIECQENRFFLKDLGSSNGTYLNGERAGESALVASDVIRIGQTEMEFSVRKGVPIGVTEPAEKDDGKWVPRIMLDVSLSMIEQKAWLGSILDWLLRKCNADRGFIAGYDSTSEAVYVIAGTQDELLKEPADGKVPLSRSIVEEVIRRRSAVITSNAEVDPRFKEASSVAKYDICSVLCMPARWQGHPVGAIYLERDLRKDPFSESDADSIQVIGDYLGVALMAWRSGGIRTEGSWEKHNLERSFGEKLIAQVEEEGGMSSLRKAVREINVLTFSLGKIDGLLESKSEEAWRSVSQLMTQINEAMTKHEGAIVSLGSAMFGSTRQDKESHLKALAAAIEIIRIGRASVKRMIRDHRVGFASGIGIATGEALVGYFGGGNRSEYFGFGQVMSASQGLALNAQDGEILIDQATYGKVHNAVTTHRVAPFSLPGVERQVQAFRVLSF